MRNSSKAIAENGSDSKKAIALFYAHGESAVVELIVKFLATALIKANQIRKFGAWLKVPLRAEGWEGVRLQNC
jgi:hypothetical protein